jgi:hypothetical protein
VRKTVWLTAVLTHLAFSTSVPFIPQQTLIDRVVAAGVRSERRAPSLELLKAIAEGRARDIIISLAESSGMKSYVEDQHPFDSVDTRCYAFAKIGDTDLPETEAYLRGVTEETIGKDDAQHRILSSSQFALQKLLFRKEKDPRAQVLFLEASVQSRDFSIAFWATEELCKRGSIASFPLVQNRYETWWSGGVGHEKAETCRIQMDVVSRDPDQLKALSLVLGVSAQVEDEPVLRWAIGQLIALDNPRANSILDRYVTDVEAAIPDVPPLTLTPQELMHFRCRQRILASRPDRRPSSSASDHGVPAH